jgi:hypothetical protein
VTPAEIAAAMQLLSVLAPEVQKGVVDLIGKLHKHQMTANDAIAQAAKILGQPPPAS